MRLLWTIFHECPQHREYRRLLRGNLTGRVAVEHAPVLERRRNNPLAHAAVSTSRLTRAPTSRLATASSYCACRLIQNCASLPK
jgi:hypothetical protein